jgi:hypothetical protein
MNESLPLLLDCDTIHRALELYKVWDEDQRTLGLSGQLSLWMDVDQVLGLRWRVRVEGELSSRAFELAPWQ